MKNFNSLKICILCSVLCVLFSACATTPDMEDIKKAEAHYKLGVSYLNTNRFKDASIEFQKAISFNPKDKYSLNALGLISASFKEYDKAISYYKRAISADSSYSEALNNLGVTYMEMEKWDEAINYFKKALENPLYETPEKAYSNIGYALYKRENYSGALNLLSDAIKKYPWSSQVHYVLGIVYMKIGKIQDAIEEFNSAVNASPSYSIDAQWELANAYLMIGDKKKAMEHFKIIVDISSDAEMKKKALKYIELLNQ